MTDRSRSRHALLIGAVLTLVAALCGCAPSAAQATSTPSTHSSALATGSSEHSIMVDGQQRTFRVYRPATLSTSRAAPLVVMLHGAIGSGKQAENSYGWDQEADKDGFIVAYPDGLHRTWAVSDDCCGPPAKAHVNDVAFITSMVNAVSESTSVDRDRIYASGISNGGMLAYRLACDTHIFAAIGVDSTTMLNECPSPARISVMHIHGTADDTIPYDGGPGKRDNGGGGPDPADTSGPPIPTLLADWRAVDGCSSPTDTTAGQVTTSIANCPDSRNVVLITIAGAGHQWPGQSGPQGPAASALHLDPPFTGLDATDTIWTFFASHPKPRG